MGYQYIRKYELQTYDFNVFYQLKSETIMNMLQDISTRHYNAAVKFNPQLDLSETEENIWVVVDWDVVIHTSPETVQTLNVMTEPVFFRKFIGFRRYQITSETGEVFVEAISKWAYVNKASRKQITIPEVLYDVFGVMPKAPKPEKISYTSDISECIAQKSYTAVYSDIDINGHVNNVSYYRWTLDMVPMALIKTFRPYEIKIHYKHEVLLDETVTLSLFRKYSEDHKKIIMMGNICHDDSECVTCEIKWLKRVDGIS